MNAETLLDGLRSELAEGGIVGSFTAFDLDTGRWLGLDADRILPVASLVKIPLALVTLQRIAAGEVDGAARIDVDPGRIEVPGPTGITRFRHPATIAVEDLLSLSVSISDSAATDALFDITPPEQVTRVLRELGIDDVTVRHRLAELTDTPASRLGEHERHLAHQLAIDGGGRSGGHGISQLDLARANIGSAHAFTALLAEIWRPTVVDVDAARQLRGLMRANLIRHRLAPEFDVDAITWSSKTGTFLNLRHEIGVAEHRDGPTIVVTALTESVVAAVEQPAAEALIARTARRLHDHVRALAHRSDRFV